MRTLRSLLSCLLLASLPTLALAETCITKFRTAGGDDNIDMLIAPTALTVDAVACHCDGPCTAPLPLPALSDRAGNTIALVGPLTCSTGLTTTTWVQVNTGDPDRNLVVGEGLEYSITNTPGSFDALTLCVRFL